MAVVQLRQEDAADVGIRMGVVHAAVLRDQLRDDLLAHLGIPERSGQGGALTAVEQQVDEGRQQPDAGQGETQDNLVGLTQEIRLAVCVGA